MRVLNFNIPDNKIILISLTKIYGIGLSRSRNICRKCNINFFRKSNTLNESESSKISYEVGKYLIEGNLRRYINLNIKKLIDIKCYRGFRHLRKLPVRGQRTRTNARTRKGPRKKFFKK